VQIPKITADNVRRQCGDKNFERGEQYYKNGSIFEARIDKQMLKGSCSGSRDTAYHVTAGFKKTGIGECHCTCPVGTNGYCKHIAALLLTWVHRPKLFEQMPDIEKALHGKDKKELIGLIGYLLQYDPDLELVLAARLTADTDTASFGSTAYYRQAQTVFERAVHQQAGELDLADKLSAIKSAGDDLLTDGDYPRAIAVFAGVADGVTDKLKAYQYFDEEGYMGEVVTECVQNIGTCLEYETDSGARNTAIMALMAVYEADTEFFGGIGLSDEVPEIITKLTNDDEKRTVATRLGELLQKSGRPDYEHWACERHKDFLDNLS
jgi:uncharacterized Zn finger protein